MERHRSRFVPLVCLLALGTAGCAAGSGSTGSAFGADASGGEGGGGGAGADASIPLGTGGGARINVDASSKDSGQDDGGVCSLDGGCTKLVGCGNGRLDPGRGEACDDGNAKAGDGCSADCKAVETGFACPEPGRPCVSTVQCGDGVLAGNETCDDGNTNDRDGCSSQCTVERGYRCTAGTDCVPICGDGLLRGSELCDPPRVGSGCGADCRFEPGYVCAPPAALDDAGTVMPPLCHPTKCGDGTAEGDEACDDGNSIDGDGCSAICKFEPDCSSGTCVSKCGDGLSLPPEECDDGNTVDGDGCSKDCALEDGWRCTDQTVLTADALNLMVVFRDFNAVPVKADGSPVMGRHPDYEGPWKADKPTLNLVLPELDADGKPVLTGCCSDTPPTGDSCTCSYGQLMTSQANFSQWYRDTPDVNVSVKGSLMLPQQANGSYVFDSNDTKGFFPLDAKGWVAAGKEQTSVANAQVNDGKAHNFGFSSEVRYFFLYRGGERLTFSGDDDVWVFINRKLALDLGGLHPRVEGTLVVDDKASALGLVKGRLYEMVLFHAERHTSASNFKLTLTGFAPAYSKCTEICGDGIVTSGEHCDPGTRASADAGTAVIDEAGAAGASEVGVAPAGPSDGYGACTAECNRGPFCGDGTVQTGHEACDDGVNLTPYQADGKGCAPGCHTPSRCGDGKVDALFGEECDDGPSNQDGLYGGCTIQCVLGPRCGDGILQKGPEACDDGNTLSGDGCDSICVIETIK